MYRFAICSGPEWSGLLRRRNGLSHLFRQPLDTGHELLVGISLLPGVVVNVVLQPHADVAAHGQSRQQDLIGAFADAESAPRAVFRQMIDQIYQIFCRGLHAARRAQAQLEVGRLLQDAFF